jgi:hypothetical protein
VSGGKKKATDGVRKHPRLDTHVTLLISVVSWSTILYPRRFSLLRSSFFMSWNLVSKCIILRAKFGDTTPPGNLHTFTFIHPVRRSRVLRKEEKRTRDVQAYVEGNFHQYELSSNVYNFFLIFKYIPQVTLCIKK